jgi:methylated-DNA-[protein]-cysteine S-methyltransferase
MKSLDNALIRSAPPANATAAAATARIPYGDAATYSEVAARAGSPRAMRAAGNALGRNPIPIVVPCHRVLRTGGGLGGYGGGLDRKRYLLDLESGVQALTPPSAD